ncbi:MAG: hypothetical protein KAQ67_05560, partial [Gammaproteobacteria bacterium]|nr:hypothetical protein [Gammaproteobacteria bacterium]
FIGYSANFNKGPGTIGPDIGPYTDIAADTRLGSGALGITVLFANIFVVFGLRFFARKRRLAELSR